MIDAAPQTSSSDTPLNGKRSRTGSCVQYVRSNSATGTQSADRSDFSENMHTENFLNR